VQCHQQYRRCGGAGPPSRRATGPGWGLGPALAAGNVFADADKFMELLEPAVKGVTVGDPTETKNVFIATED
jgi:hypothetical protein